MKNIAEKSTKLNILYTLLYGIFTLIVVLSHEIWADEAQVWQIVQNVSFLGLFKHLVNEGHPSLFYLINMPFAKAGFSAVFMQIFCWLCTTVSVFLLWQFAPFKQYTKFAITLSAGFLYFFPVIARSYSIIPLLVFAIALVYPHYRKKPFLYALLLFLTANTHVIMLGLCALLSLDFLYCAVLKEDEKSVKKRNIFAFLIMASGMAAVVAQLALTMQSNAVIGMHTLTLWGSCVKVFTQFFLNAVDNQWAEPGSFSFAPYTVTAALISVVLYIALFVLLFKKNKKIFAIGFLAVIFQLLIYIAGYNHWIFVNRIFCAHLVLIFCFWIVLNKNDRLINILLSLFFTLTVFNGLKYAVLDIHNPYSGAKETAEFIKNNIDKDNSVIVTDNPPYAVGVVYYLNGKNSIYCAQQQKNISYVVWDKSLLFILDSSKWPEYARFVMQNEPDFKNKKLYALVPFFDADKFDVDKIDNFKLIFESKPSMVKLEGFRIYEYLNN